jgi:hypothetical protein
LVYRFGLEQNQLTTLPMEICKLTHLSYLNVSSNAFKEFPEAVRTTIYLFIYFFDSSLIYLFIIIFFKKKSL